MRLYLDTSALVKLYIEEEGSPQVAGCVDAAATVASALIAYPEAIAAFARKKREHLLDPREFIQVKKAFERDWESFIQIGLSGALAVKAVDLAEKHGLRGYDAVHLASALDFQARLGEAVIFLDFVQALLNAAGKEGLLTQ